MDTIFSYIVQKRFSQVNEDVATDALAFILHSSERARNGFMKLLRGIEPDLPDLQFRTQQSEGNIRPDMWGFDGSDPRVFVENKFWAGLTENQPVSYLETLAGSTQPTVLLFVVPEARKQTIWRELRARLKEARILMTDRETSAGVVHSANTQGGPLLALTSWPRLLSVLESEAAEDQKAMGDLVQLRALCVAADGDAFVPVSVEETSDQRTPAFILQLGTIVKDTVELAKTKGVIDSNKLRPQASWLRIGHYISFLGEGGVGSWIGIHFGLWKRYGGTPIWLVFTPGNWGRSMEVRRVLEPWATKEGFTCCSESGNFALGLDLATGDEKDSVVRSIVDDLKGVATALSELPPIPTSAEPSDE